MSPKISVLIPVYNAQKYLQACLASIQKQTFTDFEIVCLDDGSTDDSLDELKNFQKHESRLQVLTQANAGVAATRNRLMRQARGTYIAFVDADDVIAPDYLEKLYTAAQESGADITKCFFKEISEDGKQISSARCSHLFYKTPSDTLTSCFICGYHDSIVWGKLFRRAWLEDINIFFLEERICEDLPFTTQAFLEARQITIVPQHLYFYRKGLTHCVTTQDERVIIDWLKNLLDLQHILRFRSLWKDEVIAQWVKVVVWRICAFRKLPAAERAQYIPLQQQAFRQARQAVWAGGWRSKLRWGGLFVLVRLCGWRSVYFWTKIFR
ncbi:MAG: glycosyltransferase [Elusimicrobiaceae bacterium]|nr:glycosyltransferase [Elusimicrobiaceae bacterium]